MPRKRFYVTTPIYYVNAPPHLGHAYTTIVADVMARYHRLAGYETFFLTGTDEHGDKVARAAKEAGISPKEYADRISQKFRYTWPQLEISNDYFIRTTDPQHVKTVQLILQKVYDAGDIYFGEYGGLYCVGCERFYTERELVDGKCPDHNVEPEYRKEKNYFFRMSKYQDWLVSYIKEHPDFIRPERYKNEVLSFLNEPLEDLCISRPKERLSWGITLPFDEDYVCYVWFDALINYVSALGYPDGENYKKFWPVAQHLIAKDILKPHAVYWPTMLKSAGIPLYKHLNVHGYWSVDESKMSKSLGNVVKPLELKDKYGVEAFRYFLMREMVFGLDSSFSEEGLVNRLNSDLANDLGNLLYRILPLVERHLGGIVPEPGSFLNRDIELRQKVVELAENYGPMMENLLFHKALASIWEVVAALNKYIDERAPWALAKDERKRDEFNTVVYNVLESLRIIAWLLSPFMPKTASTMLEQVGASGDTKGFLDDLVRWGGLKPGVKTRKSRALFPRVEPIRGEKKEEKAEPFIDIADFKRLSLRVARVLSAERIEGSKKLLRLGLDMGDGFSRTVVAGLGENYAPDDLVGKLVVVLANLRPMKLMGVESQGMILAAVSGDKVRLVTVDGDIDAGSGVE